MKIRSRKSKRKLEPEPPPRNITKKLRQKLPRRRRQNISPVLLFRISGENPGFSVDSSSGSDFAAGEASCNSSRASAAGKGNTNSWNESSIDSARNRRFEKRNENEVEVSESSCVDSSERSRSLILKFKRENNKNPKENDDVSDTKSDITTIPNFKSGRETKNLKENDDVSCTKSEITSEEQCNLKSGNGDIKISSESNGNDVVSFSLGLRASFEEEKNRNKENRASESEYSSRNLHAEETCADLIAQSITKQEESDNYDVVADLACSEDLRFSYCDDKSEYSSSQGTVFSELHSEIFGECSQPELLDYSPSLFEDSGSQFSQGSVGETPSPTYLLFLQYRKEFSTLASASPVMNASSVVEDDVNFVRFEDSDDEESYQILRKRERRQGFLTNYGERYFCTTEFGETVLEQRTQMVQWMVEQSYRKQLRQETMFLGVNLLDRFLSKGYFKAKRNLQIVGIACLTIATRIEENQQYNRFYLKTANADAVVEKRVKYLAVLALSGHEQLCYWPSTVAAALVILACLEVNQNSSLEIKRIHVRSKDDNLYECIESLEWLLRYLG
ncbi:Cyclin-SDS protein [Spatholobus suberectus]|nr:Cyclin-SDS protein [Spatholobus suberectus]